MVHDDLVITKLFKVFMAELESLARNLSRDAYAFQAASMILTLRLFELNMACTSWLICL